MRSKTLWLVAAVGAAVFVLTAPAYGELKIGIVDIVQVMDNYERMKDANADVKIEMDNLKAQAEPRMKQVQDLQLRRDGFNRGTEEWKKANESAVKAEVDWQAWFAFERVKVEAKQREVLTDMYRQINSVVARVAKANTLDVVFAKAFSSVSLEEGQGLEDIKNRILNQRILYPAPTLDLTQEILRVLNTEYKASKKAVGGPK